MHWIRRSTSPRMKGSTMQCSSGIMCITERKSLIWWWSLMSILPAPACAEPTFTTAGKVYPYIRQRCEEAKCAGTTGNLSFPSCRDSLWSCPCTTGRSQKRRMDCREFTAGTSAKSRPFRRFRPSKSGVLTSFLTSTKSGWIVLGYRSSGCLEAQAAGFRTSTQRPELLYVSAKTCTSCQAAWITRTARPSRSVRPFMSSGQSYLSAWMTRRVAGFCLLSEPVCSGSSPVNSRRSIPRSVL
mmetsp:Transcript_13747/g.43475  ORF Transcript_13747/g.43475 Transcript_13747/m.43475 type:complete len:241 (+) Transcript_13747:345-1067(+)